MSFSSEAKAELCRMNRKKKCCAVAEAYGVALYCNSFTPREIRIITGSAEFVELLPRLFRRAFGVSFDKRRAGRVRLAPDPADNRRRQDNHGVPRLRHGTG